ncbi:hypothetical protein EON79_07550 [bacterium]|nr:MAG: hypothetical protein EON79_07550 [bacterium]
MLRPIVTPAQAMGAHKESVEFIQQALQDKVDYGIIPGTGDKKNLLKPGAERLCAGFGLRAEYEIIEKEVDHDRSFPYLIKNWTQDVDPGREEKERLKAAGLGRNRNVGTKDKPVWQWQVANTEEGKVYGLYRYVIRCRLFFNGTEVGQGVGSCSSLESKYIRSPRDNENTILKMGKKRAYVDAVLTTLGLSDRFTQDVEDMRDNKAARNEDDYIDTPFVEETPAPAEDPFKPSSDRIVKAIQGLKLSREDLADWRTTLGGFGYSINRDIPLVWAQSMGARDVQDAYSMLDCGAITPEGPNPEKWAAHLETLKLELEGAGVEVKEGEASPEEIDDAVSRLLQEKPEGEDVLVPDGEAEVSGTMPEGLDFFGWNPTRWPQAKQWLSSGSEQQRRLLLQKLRERGMDADADGADAYLDLIAGRANQPARARSNATYAISIDFLLQASEESIDAAVEALPEQAVTA